MIIMYHSICLTLSLKSCKEDAFRTSFGNEFHSLGAEYEKDLSNIDVLDLGTANVPLADDLSVRFCVSDAGFNRVVIYSGVRLFNALYVKTALLYFNRSRIESHPNSWNMSLDGVLYSACSIIRAARFWSFDSLSRLHEDVLPQVTDP